MRRAIGVYRAFRETQPKRAQRYTLRLPGALARVGPVEFIGYTTTHKGKAALYVHYFAPGSRPVLYASSGRGQLYLIGQRHKFTGGGITDLDARGRVVDYRPRFKVVQTTRPTLHNNFRSRSRRLGGLTRSALRR